MKTEEKRLSVPAIKAGTVIDHIAPGKALLIVEHLQLCSHKKRITIGLNLDSKSMIIKDLIKIEDVFLTPKETDQIALFSPMATVNVIDAYEVVHKFTLAMPEKVEGMLSCPNPRCITNSEKVLTSFLIEENQNTVSLLCRFCEKRSPRERNKHFP